ncbi:MAG: site-specific DNA-methyltransferase [Bacteroidales bacterium]|nr:site-specific DNA-methyltransferase [Bacteroidales bacterium]
MNATKQTLIAEIEKRVSDKILEQTNADLLIKLINNADSLDEAINIAALGTTYKRTGLHFDKRLEKMSDTIKYFKKNEALSFHTDDSKPTHKLIIGDNYEALQNLLIQYRGKIDVIYIDPPYGKDSMGEFAATNYNNAITRDNLLSMLYPRLTLAKQLLSDEGVIFCSIDDKNQAYVKCLFDEVMGESNFVSNSIIVNNRGGRDYGGIAIQHEYLIIFAKNIFEYELNPIDDAEKIFQYSDEIGGFNLMELRNRNVKFNDKNRPNLFYPFYLNPNKKDKNGLFEISLEKDDQFCIEVLPAISQGIQTVWRWGKEEKARENLNKVIFGKENQNGGYMIVQKYRKTTKMQRSIWDEKEFVNERGTESVKDILGSGIFAYPKSTYLIKRVFELSTKHDSIILDFFAGSGTTGHAVLDLNRSEAKEGDLLNEKTPEGNRTFILCQLNEKTDTTPNGIAYDVTSKRLKRIMTGECYDGTKDFEWIKKNKPYGGNLDVYEIESVSNFEWTEGKTPFDVIDETLYGKEKFANIKEKIEWVCGNFDKTQKYLEQQKTEE